MKHIARARATALAVAALVAVTGVASAAASTGAPDQDTSISDLPVAQANPDVSEELIASLPEVVQQSDVTIDSSFEAGTPIIYPDGTPVEGQSEQAQRAAVVARAFCGATAFANGLGNWGSPSYCNVAVFGSVGWTQGYAWSSAKGIANPRGCAQGLGFNAQKVQTWYGLGVCGQGDAYSIPWGNVLATPGVRVKSLSIPVGFNADWSSS